MASVISSVRCFSAGGKYFATYDLAQRLAQLVIHAAGAALPALLLLLRAVQNVRVEVPVLLVEALRQAGSRVGVQQVPAQVGLDLVQRRIGQQRIELREKLRLGIVHLAGGGRVVRGHIVGQGKVRQLLGEAGHVRGMVQVLRVALLGDGERGLGQAGFDSQHCPGIFGGLRLRLARQRKYLLHVGHILLALLHALGVGARVVVALRQAQPARAIEADDRIGIGEVLVRSHAEEGIHADGVQMRQQRGQLRRRFERGNAVQFRLERRQPQLVHGRRVHATGVVVADLLLIGRARGRGRGCLFENLLQMQAVQLDTAR